MKLPENFNINGNKSTILIAPLDWGLGHATRCIPIIKTLLAHNHTIIIAANGNTEILLKQEFPALLFLKLDGYNITYSKTKFGLPFKILLQLPKIFSAIKKENSWLQSIIDEYKIDVVISDNRPGLYSKKIKSIYITHQLTIKAKNKFIEGLLQKTHYSYINKFNECWVPDFEGENNLAGELSHPSVKPNIPVYFINPLSRFVKKDLPIIYEAAIVLSGPEPQRTIFENIILRQLENVNKKVVLVRGLPKDNSIITINNSALEVYNFLPANELNNLFIQSAIIISRSGYSTIMDLETLQKKAILIPTPGQTEQLYLAKILTKQKRYTFVEQNQFKVQNFL